MSMTAYNILECRKQDIYKCREERGKRAQRENDLTSARSLLSLRRGTADSLERRCSIDRLSPRSERARISFFTHTHIYYDVYNDTRPSGERESGSYSGTRQRNRIQFGPS